MKPNSAPQAATERGRADLMTTAIGRYLFGYAAKRRALALIAAIGWAAAFSIGWLILFHTFQRFLPMHRLMLLAGITVAVAIVARPVLTLFRAYDPVSAAAEIESQLPEFDQRLITVASQPNQSQMLLQLTIEVEAITTREKARVPLRPLLAPLLAVIAALLLSSAMDIHLLGVVSQMISRSGK